MKKYWSNFDIKGWCFLDPDIENDRWTRASKQKICHKFEQAEYKNEDFRSGLTWFAGINFLGNGIRGDVNGVPFSPVVWSKLSQNFGSGVKYWDAGQVSIFWKGYPRKDSLETEKSFKYRLNRYSSHLDGIIPIGAKKRRFAKEFHAFILGIPIINTGVESAPLIVWEGSHVIFRNMFREVYDSLSEREIRNLDVTKIYQECRRQVFLTCPARKVVPVNNQPYVLDRHLLHGVAPWSAAKSDLMKHCKEGHFPTNPLSGRVVIYFRPVYKNPIDWITRD